MLKNTFVIGQIVNVHGIQGEVKVYPLTDDINRFKILNYILIDNEMMEVIGCKFLKNMVILKIKGIDTIEKANKYRNKYIRIKREDAIPLENENTFYVADIIDCDVYDTLNKYIGKVYDVIKLKSNDVYWVKSLNNKDIMIPALRDIIQKIDIKSSKILIRPITEWQVEE